MTEAQQKLAAEWIGRGETQAVVARRLKVSVRTLQRYLKRPALQAAAAEARANIDPSAADVLRALLSSDSETIRLQAARALLATPPPPEEHPSSPSPTIHVLPALPAEGAA